MDDKLSKVVKEMLDGVGTMSSNETIVGEAQKAGDATIIPVHSIKMAFGAGVTDAGAHAGDAGGDWGGQAAGGAIEVDPIAAIAISPRGEARLMTIEGRDEASTWASLIKDVPSLLGKVARALGDRASDTLRQPRALAGDSGRALPPGEKAAAEEEKPAKRPAKSK